LTATLSRISHDTLFRALEPYSESIFEIYRELGLNKSKNDVFATPDEIDTLLTHVKDESNKPFLPFVLGWNYPSSKAGDLFLAMMTSSGVYEALNVLKNYYHLYSLFGEYIYIESKDTLRIHIVFPWDKSENIHLQKMATTRIHRLLHDVFGHSFVPIKVSDFIFHEEIARFFRLPAFINRGEAGVIFHYDTKCFSISMESADASTFTHFSEKLKKFKARNSTAGHTDPVLAIDRLFDVIQSKDWKKETFARELGQSGRSLDRMLKRYNTSFNLLHKRQMRSRSMKGMLMGKSISTIAEELGYSERKSFERAFKSWTGITPTVYKEHCELVAMEDVKNDIISSTNIPLFTDVTMRMIQKSDSSKISIDGLCNIVVSEPALAAKVLCYSMSTYNKEFQVNDLREAILKCIQIDSVLSLLMDTMPKLNTFTSHDFHLLSYIEIWQQIKCTQEIILLLKESFVTDKIDWTTLFFTAVCKDVGLLYLIENREVEIYGALGAQNIDDYLILDINEMIRESFGISSYSISSIILMRWGCDMNILDLIDRLDYGGNRTDDNECYLLNMAELLAQDIRCNEKEGVQASINLISKHFARLGVKGTIEQDRLESVLKSSTDEVSKIFSCNLDALPD